MRGAGGSWAAERGNGALWARCALAVKVKRRDRSYAPHSILHAAKTEGTMRSIAMPEKLLQGDRFPTIALNLTDGSTMTLPEQIPGRYLALLFYRGGW